MKEIKEILEITKRLKKQYNRNFTLDGNLVGDMGEVLAAEKYGLTLLDRNTHKHDGKEKSTNRLVQVKSSFSDRAYFPCKYVPDYYLAIKISEDGTIEELFNGKGSFIVNNYLKPRELKPKNRQVYVLSANILRRLNDLVPQVDKIKVLKKTIKQRSTKKEKLLKK